MQPTPSSWRLWSTLVSRRRGRNGRVSAACGFDCRRSSHLCAQPASQPPMVCCMSAAVVHRCSSTPGIAAVPAVQSTPSACASCCSLPSARWLWSWRCCATMERCETEPYALAHALRNVLHQCTGWQLSWGWLLRNEKRQQLLRRMAVCRLFHARCVSAELGTA